MPADINDGPSDLASFARSAKPAMTKRLRELARESPGADIYEPCTLWDNEEKGKRTNGVRVSGATSGDRQEVRLNLWRRAPGTLQALARAAAATEGWDEVPDGAGGTIFQHGPVTLAGDEAKNTATLVYSEEQDKPFSASSFRMYLGALFDELVKLAESPEISKPAEAPGPAPRKTPEEGIGDAGSAPNEPLAAVAVDDDDDETPIAEVFEVDDFDQAEVVTEAHPEPAPAPPESQGMTEAQPQAAPPPPVAAEPAPAAPVAEQAAPEPASKTFAAPDEVMGALESGELNIVKTAARTEIEGHEAEITVTEAGRRKLITVTVEGMPGLDAGTITSCKVRLRDRTYTAKSEGADRLVIGKKSPAPVPPPPAIKEAMDYAASFLRELAPKEPVAPAEPPQAVSPAAAPPGPPPEEATSPGDTASEDDAASAPSDAGIEVEEVSLDDLLGSSDEEAAEPPEEPTSADSPPDDAISSESLPAPPPEEDEGEEEAGKGEAVESPAPEEVSAPADAEEEPQVPEEVPEMPFGDFQAKRWIGRDVLGVLYEGVNTKTGEAAAIKVIDSEHSQNAKFAKDFVREGWTASKLEHPGLNRILTVGRTKLHVYYYASEFAEARSARAVVRSGEGFSIEDSKRVVRAIAEALAYVHSNKLYHGDVRPSYILLTADGGAKLAEMAIPKNTLGCIDRLLQAQDQGLDEALKEEENEARKAMDDIIRKRRVICWYLAPELADPRFKADGRADIYGLGATWYYMLTGKPPFADMPPLQLLMGEAGKAPPPEELKADIPPGLSAIIQKMMDPLPSERYQTMEEVVAAIDGL